MNEIDLKSVGAWGEGALAEAWQRANLILKEKKRVDDFSRYQNDPVGFMRYVFRENYTDDTIDVANSVANNIVTIAKSANAIGKTFIAARIALWWFSVYEQSKVFVTAASPLDNLRLLLWGEIMAASKKTQSLVAGCQIKGGNNLAVIRDTENFIAGVAIPTSGSTEEREAKFSGKHSPHLLFIVDEGDAVPDEVYKGIDSCMSGGMARLLIMFNPRGKSGPVYIKEQKGLANVVKISALNHPNVLTGKDVIPGAVTRETTLRRIHMWTRPLASNETRTVDCFEVPDFLANIPVMGLDGKSYPPLEVGDVRKVVDPSFSYMVLGEYPAQGATSLISDEWINAARTRFDLYVATYGNVPPQGVKPIMGIDCAEYGPDSSVIVFRYGGYVSKFHTWGGVDPDKLADHAVRLYKEKNTEIAMVDATGVGSSVAPAMARRGRDVDCRAVSVKVGEKPSPIYKSALGDFQQMRDQIWWRLRDWLKDDPSAMLPPDPMLIEELKAIEYEITNFGKIKVTTNNDLRDRLKRSPDRGTTLALTFAPFERAKWTTVSTSRE